MAFVIMMMMMIMMRTVVARMSGMMMTTATSLNVKKRRTWANNEKVAVNQNKKNPINGLLLINCQRKGEQKKKTLVKVT
jgi:anionic cell wall polymer biosynthesis LytR-Cps2A-Psr (LCP) family protein